VTVAYPLSKPAALRASATGRDLKGVGEMTRKVAFLLTLVLLVVNFFQPAVTFFPHLGAEWTAPWPMQIAHASITAAYPTMDELERWVAFAILAFLFERFAFNLERTLEVIHNIWGDR